MTDWLTHTEVLIQCAASLVMWSDGDSGDDVEAGCLCLGTVGVWEINVCGGIIKQRIDTCGSACHCTYIVLHVCGCIRVDVGVCVYEGGRVCMGVCMGACVGVGGWVGG